MENNKSTKIIKNSIPNTNKFLAKYSDFEYIIVNSLTEYIDAINYHLKRYHIMNNDFDQKYRNKYIFRGLSNFNELSSTLKRHNLSDKEYNFIKKFEENGCMKLGQFNNAIDMAAAARHYGIRSRLIDWSTSPLVATLFALYDENPNIKINNENDEDHYYALAIRNYDENCLTLHSLYVEDKYRNAPLNIQYQRMITNYEKLLESKSVILYYLGERISLIQNNKNFIDEAYNCCNYINKKTMVLDKVITKTLKNEFTNVKDYFTHIYFNTNYIDLEELSCKSNCSPQIIKMIKRFLKKDINIYLETNFSNERLRNQRGVFEIDDINNKYSYDNITYNNKNPKKNLIIKSPFLILINKKARIEIIKYIDKLGINYYMLMDDSENTSKIINDTVIDKISFENLIQYK